MREDKYGIYTQLDERIASMDSMLDVAIKGGSEANAITKKKNKTALGLIIGIIAVICIIFLVVLTQVILPKVENNRAQQALADKYKTAQSEADSGNLSAAIDLYASLGDYQDSEARVAELEKQQINDAKVGDVISYGNHSKDENGEKESIKWFVIDKEGSNLLLLSEKILGYCQMEEDNWRDSELRKAFENDEPEFPSINYFFSKDEQSIIVQKKLKTTTYYEYSSSYGSNIDVAPSESISTKDRLFLLSKEDVEKYGNEWMVVGDSWWTRTSYCLEMESVDHKTNSMNEFYARIWNAGDLGIELTSGEAGIRPAMWVKTSN